ncbi:MAG: hypothetical protein GXP62_06660 [Oligoflexia bacterium]|nr:hypothetical protein [Oligoflexia bacterium]
MTVLLVPALLAVTLSCARTATQVRPLLQPQASTALEPAELVAAADLDGDGRDEIVRVRHETAWWGDQHADLGGIPQATARGDIDGDGRQEALIATGMGRGELHVPARLWAISAQGADLLWEQQGERAQVTDLHVLPDPSGGPDRIFLATFVDRRMVAGGFLKDGVLDIQHKAALALCMLPVDAGLLVGRLYGDQPKSPGDLRLVGETTTTIPTLRGVRALAAADLDGDGLQDYVIADGWHFAYGQQADSTVRIVPGDGSPARVIARLDDSYTVRHLDIFTPPDGGPPVILATASHQIVLLQRDKLGWAPVKLATATETDNAVLVADGAKLSVVVSGQPARRVPLARGTAMIAE